MIQKTKRDALLLVCQVVFLALIFLVSVDCRADECELPAAPYEKAMTISPQMIVLNYNGASEYVITDFSAPIGYMGGTIGDFCVALYFNGVQVAQAVDIQKTLTGKTAVYFDRQGIQDNPVVQALAGLGIVDAQIIGWFDAQNYSGETVTNVFVATDPDGVEIVDPGYGN